MTKISIKQCDKYDIALTLECLRQMLAETDFPEVKGKTVLVKPNIVSDASPSKAICTHPVVLDALLTLLEERGPKSILVGDSPGLQGVAFRPRASGLYQVCEKHSVKFVDFTANPVKTKLNYKNTFVPIAECVFKADVVISLAKMKTHQLMYVTGCVKNMFGVVPGLNKSPLHLKAPDPDNFAKLITDIYECCHVNYAILDAIVGMEGPGPANGFPREVGLLIASKDPYGVDYAQILLLGQEPCDIPIYNEGLKRGNTDPSSYIFTALKPKRIDGYKTIPIQKRGLFRSLILPYFQKALLKRKSAPFFNENCVQCQKCVRVCPAKALTLEDNKIKIDKNLCIRCYCCHEFCPVGAIEIKE